MRPRCGPVPVDWGKSGYIPWRSAFPGVNPKSPMRTSLPPLLLVVCVSLCATLAAASETPAHRVVIQADAKDNSAALRKGLEDLRAKQGGTLSLAKGAYPFRANAKSAMCVAMENLENVTIDGGGATLVGHDLAGLFSFRNCRKLVIRNLTVAWEPLPFTCGRVVARVPEAHAFDMVPLFPEKPVPGRIVQAVLAYDPAKGRLADDGWEVYQTQGERDNAPMQVTPAGHGRVFLAQKARLPEPGWHVIVRHQVYSYNAFSFDDCAGVTMEDVTVESAPGMAVVAFSSRDFTLRHLRVVPPAGAWMSVTADAVHFRGCRGQVTLDDCEFAGMGDDALNVHGMYGRVAARLDERSLAVQEARMHSYYDKERRPWDTPQSGDVLEYGGGSEPLLPQGQLRVVEARQEPKAKRTVIRVAEPLPAAVGEGALLANLATTPSLRVRNCSVRGNRARGFLLQTRDVLVENCRFEGVSGAGIQICTDADEWHESLGAQNVTVRNCLFRDCNAGVARRAAALDIFADLAKGRAAAAGVHADLHLLGNTFEANHGAAINVGSADGVEVRGNRFLAPKPPVIRITNSRNVTLADNPGLAAAEAVKVEGASEPPRIVPGGPSAP